MPDGSSLAEVKISQLPVGTAANPTDMLEASQSAGSGGPVSRSVTLDQVTTLIAGSTQIDAAIDAAVGAVVGSFLPLAGGTLSGPLNSFPSTFAAPSLAQSWNSQQSADGTTTGPTNLNHSKIYSDTVNAANASGSDYFVEGFTHEHYFGGSTVRGGRNAVSAYLSLTAPTASNNDNLNYTALAAVATAFSSDNGTGTTSTTGRGSLFGVGATAVAKNGATNLQNVTGVEFNVAMQTGSSVYAKSLAQFSSRVDDAVKGSGVDAMLWLYKQAAGGPTWTNGILFNHPAQASAFPFDATSTVMATGAGTIGTGIDLSASTVATAAFKSPGFTVGGTGGLTGTTATFSANVVVGGTIQFGGTTNAFPALQRNGAALSAMLADGSNLATFNANNLNTQNGLFFATFGSITSPGVDGQFTFFNNAGTAATRLDIATDGTIKFRNRTNTADATVTGQSFQANAAGVFNFAGRSVVFSDSDGMFRLTTSAQTVGVALDFATDATLKVRRRLNTLDANLTANQITAMANTAIGAGGTGQAFILGSTTANFGVFYGSGAPGFTAAANSLYVRSDGNSTTTRLYVNTTGSTTWATVTTSA